MNDFEGEIYEIEQRATDAGQTTKIGANFWMNLVQFVWLVGLTLIVLVDWVV